MLPAPSLIFDAGLELLRNGELADALAISGTRVVQGLVLGGVIDPVRIGGFVQTKGQALGVDGLDGHMSDSARLVFTLIRTLVQDPTCDGWW